MAKACCFSLRVQKCADLNQMCTKNLSLLFAPSLFQTDGKGEHEVKIMEDLIDNFLYVFDVSTTQTSPHFLPRHRATLRMFVFQIDEEHQTQIELEISLITSWKDTQVRTDTIMDERAVGDTLLMSLLCAAVSGRRSDHRGLPGDEDTRLLHYPQSESLLLLRHYPQGESLLYCCYWIYLKVNLYCCYYISLKVSIYSTVVSALP